MDERDKFVESEVWRKELSFSLSCAVFCFLSPLSLLHCDYCETSCFVFSQICRRRSINKIANKRETRTLRERDIHTVIFHCGLFRVQSVHLLFQQPGPEITPCTELLRKSQQSRDIVFLKFLYTRNGFPLCFKELHALVRPVSESRGTCAALRRRFSDVSDYFNNCPGFVRAGRYDDVISI